MKILHLFLAVTFSSSFLLIAQGFNQRAAAQTKEQITALTDAGFRLIMPQYLPKGFRLASFNNTKNGYEAVYRGPNNCKVTINSNLTPDLVHDNFLPLLLGL